MRLEKHSSLLVAVALVCQQKYDLDFSGDVKR
jgi:hypothetical protein